MVRNVVRINKQVMIEGLCLLAINCRYADGVIELNNCVQDSVIWFEELDSVLINWVPDSFISKLLTYQGKSFYIRIEGILNEDRADFFSRCINQLETNL